MLAQANLIDGRYALVRQLGAGGFAEVWLARDNKTSDQVALKLPRGVRSPLAGTPSPQHQREFAAAARLKHPNIVRVLRSGESDGEPYLVLEYVDGPTLRDELRRTGPLPLEHVEELGQELTSALAHAHGRGVLHNDIKPENILLGTNGAKLTDFGAAAGLLTTLTATPADFAATLAYLAPEVLNGAEPDARSDIYALGLVLYEAAAGRLPWDGTTAAAIAGQRMAGPPPALTSFNAEAPPELSAALERALQPQPESRFASAAELGLAMRGVEATVPIARGNAGVAAAAQPAVAAPPVTQPAARPLTTVSRRSSAWLPLTAVGAGGVAAVVGLAGLVGALRDGGDWNGVPRAEPTATADIQLVADDPTPTEVPAAPTATPLPPTPTPRPIIVIPLPNNDRGAPGTESREPKNEEKKDEKKDEKKRGDDDDGDD